MSDERSTNQPPSAPEAPGGWQPWRPPPPPPGPGWAPAPQSSWPDQQPGSWPVVSQPPDTRWGTPAAGYWQAPPQQGNSAWAIVAAVVLLVMGVLLGLVAVGLLAFAAAGDELLTEIDPTFEGTSDAIASVLIVFAVIMLLLAIVHVVAAIGVFVHKVWARWTGLIVAVIGLVFGVLMLLGSMDVGLGMADLVLPIAWVAAYGFAIAGLAIGGEHFALRYPNSFGR